MKLWDWIGLPAAVHMIVAVAMVIKTVVQADELLLLPSVPAHHWTFDGNINDSGTTTTTTIIGQTVGPVEYSTWDHIHGTASLRFQCCNAKVIWKYVGQQYDPLTNHYYTLSLWFKVDEIISQGVRYLYEEKRGRVTGGGMTTAFAIRITRSLVQVAVLDDGNKNERVVSAGRIQKGKWHHVVVTFSSSLISVFLDGKQGRSSLQTEYGKFVHGATIGAGGLLQNDTAIGLVGSIDDLRIWDTIALSSAQVATLYSNTVAQQRPNILLIVADDLNFDSVGFMGGVAPEVTPNIDKLASESHVFTRTHAAVSVCQPSRQAMLSGKYPPNYGSVGFNPMEEGTRTVVTNLGDARYLTASFYKLGHMQPDSSFPWMMTDDNTFIKGRIGSRPIGRAPTLLAEASRATIAASQNVDQPFFLVINSADSHRPFPGDSAHAELAKQEMVEDPSRLYQPSEVTLPSPLPDLPEARLDVARYASAVRRLDDTVGRCLQVLEDMNVVNNTVVMFVSDNGMPMPFGKFETYRDSIRGPLIIRWPGILTPAIDNTSLVSLTDVAPTMLDIAGAQSLSDIDGRSLIPLIHKDPNLVWRNVIVGTRYEDIYYAHIINRRANPEKLRQELRSEGWVDAGGTHNPGTMKRTMNKRGITDGVYHYIYNHFYNAKNQTKAIPYDNGRILEAMEEAVAGGDLALSDRLDFYLYRAQEEFYNTQSDPGSEKNLIGEMSFLPHIVKLKQELLVWMVETNDPVVNGFKAFLATK